MCRAHGAAGDTPWNGRLTSRDAGTGQGDIFINTAAYAVVLGLLWLMVKKRVLFGIIPT